MKVYGKFEISKNKLQSPAYCLSADGEYSCSPAAVYDLGEGCKPAKNEHASKVLTKKILGQSLRAYKKFSNPSDPVFLKMKAVYDQHS